MTTITVKNIPDELYERLKRTAAINHRSINSEIIVCIERRVRSEPLDLDEILREAQELRQWTAARPISDDEFNALKSEGRS